MTGRVLADEGGDTEFASTYVATAPDKVLRHVWKPGDRVIWDNRGLIHRAAQFDKSQPRVMHRCTLLGDEPIQ